MVLEQRFAGYGASGRNGGWLTDVDHRRPRPRTRAAHGAEAAVALQRAMNDTVDEVIAVAAAEGIDADVAQGRRARPSPRNAAQSARLRGGGRRGARAGATTDVVLLDAGRGARARVRVAGRAARAWHPHCARVQPAKLVHGLAAAVEALGVAIHEGRR